MTKLISLRAAVLGRWLLCIPVLAVLGCLLSAPQAQAQAPESFDKSRANLMAVLRESPQQNKRDDTITPYGKFQAKAGEKWVETEMAWYRFIGDMHIRFVFDGPRGMLNVTPQDLQALGLTTNEALRVAVDNMKRVYGPAGVEDFAGINSLTSKSPDFISSYFLDRAYWEELSRRHPGGIVVAPVKRGGLLWTPATDTVHIDALRSSLPKLFETSGRMRVSSALYLFRDGRWTVYQDPLTSRQAK